MTHTPDDFDDDFHDAPQPMAGPAQRPGMSGNIRAAWHGSPLFKLFVLVVGVGALSAMAIGLLSGNKNADKAGVAVSGVPAITSVPGSKAPPAYVDAVNEASTKRANEAAKQGTSALPTPVSGDVTTAGLGPDDKESQYDPLAEFRPTVPQEATPVTPVPQQQETDAIDNDLLSKMQQQMTALFEGWRPGGIKLVQVADINQAKAGGGNDTARPPTPAGGKILISAGTVSYAQLLVEANSDIPGPILAEVMSGPFTGARVIGQFQVTHDYLILKFSKLTYRRKDYSIDAVAIDPNTTLGGLVTEKDNRYFTRLLLPAAAGFLEGFGSALSSGDTSVTSTGNVLIVQQGRQGLRQGVYRGISDAAQSAGQFFRDEASNTKPLIRVATGTPMGLFFVNSMTDSNNGAPIDTSSASLSASSAIQQAGPPLPPLGGANGLTGLNGTQILNQPGLSISVPAQSSLANGGLSVIQSTPK